MDENVVDVYNLNSVLFFVESSDSLLRHLRKLAASTREDVIDVLDLYELEPELDEFFCVNCLDNSTSPEVIFCDSCSE